jgi:serine/threonine protein kinase
MSELISKALGPWRIVKQIGVGGMATVYKSHHAAMDRYVVVKVSPAQRQSQRSEACSDIYWTGPRCQKRI